MAASSRTDSSMDQRSGSSGCGTISEARARWRSIGAMSLSASGRPPHTATIASVVPPPANAANRANRRRSSLRSRSRLLQRGAERLVARRCCPPSVGQQRELVGKPGEHAAERSVTQGRRGQLDCQWYPVQLGHDADDIGGVVIGELELRVDRAGSVHEQAHRLGGGGRGCPSTPSGSTTGNGLRRHTTSPSMSSGSLLVARITRCGQCRERRSARSATASSRCSAVVQHQRRPSGRPLPR